MTCEMSGNEWLSQVKVPSVQAKYPQMIRIDPIANETIEVTVGSDTGRSAEIFLLPALCE